MYGEEMIIPQGELNHFIIELVVDWNKRTLCVFVRVGDDMIHIYIT